MLEPVDVLGEPARQFDAVAADVVERKCGVDPGVRIVGHRDTGEDAVDAETPSVLDEVDAVRLAMVDVEAPADIRFPHPAGDVLEVVVGELEPSPYGRGRGEIEHLAGGGPPACECE